MTRSLTILIMVFEIFFGFSFSLHAQEALDDTIEIPRIELNFPDIRDLPVTGLRNFVVTSPNIAEVKSIPGDLLRIEAKGQGVTFLHIWDSEGRRSYEIKVLGVSSNLGLQKLKRGFNPRGPQFTYRLQAFNNASTSEGWDDIIYEHEFQSYVPTGRNQEWRTLLRAVTNPRVLEGLSGAPFSSATEPTYMLSYYRNQRWILAAGDSSFNTGELSVSGFPFRGALLKFQGDKEQAQIFGGWARPNYGLGEYLSLSKPQVYGYSATKKLVPNLYFTNSFIFLNQEGVTGFSGKTLRNDYVYTLGLLANPLQEKWTLEAEYGRNRDDQAFRGLVEYRPYWGRVLGSFKRVGTNYVNLSEGFLLNNYQEGNIIADFQPYRNLNFTLNYLFYQLGLDKSLTEEPSTTNHSIYLMGRWAPTPDTSYLGSFSLARGSGKISNLKNESGSITYQRFFKNRKNNLYARGAVQHRSQESNIALASTKELQGNLEGRYNWALKDQLTLNFREDIDIRHVNQTGLLNSNYTVSEFNSGVGANYLLRVFNLGGGINHFISVGSPKNTHNIQPYFSFSFKPNQAFSFETQGRFNIELQQNRYFIDLIGQLTYRFGPGVPDTLITGFKQKSKVFGKVYKDIDQNGVLSSKDPILSDLSVQLDNSSPSPVTEEGFSIKTKSGSHQLNLIIPEKYKNLKVNQANPYFFQIAEGEKKEINFGLYEGNTLVGKLVNDLNQNGIADENEPGLAGIKIKISGKDFEKIITTSASSHFTMNVPSPGNYKAKVISTSLPVGYQTVEPSEVNTELVPNELGKLPTLLLKPLTSFSGRVFIDKDKDNIYNDGDEALANIKIKLGEYITRSESDGTFLIQNIAPDSYPLSISPQQIKGAKTYIPNFITISPDAPIQSLNIIYSR